MASIRASTATVAILFLAVSAFGCTGVADQSVELSLAPQATPAPSESAEAAEAIRYVCIEGHASFTIEDIENAPAADVRADSAWELLQTLLDMQAGVEESDLPSDGWRRVVDSPEEVVLLAETADDERPYAVVHVVPGDGGYIHQGGWEVDSFGGCRPRLDVLDDVSVAEWWVDPTAEQTSPESESVPALVLERACASGGTAEGRILPPTIVYGPTEVTITIIVQRLAVDAQCPGHPPTPYVIELEEPLGERTLVDGGQFPPGDPLDAPEP